MKAIYFSVIALFCATLTQAQISHGGEPSNWSAPISSDLIMEDFSVNDLASVHREDAILDQHKDIPYRFGVNMEVDLSSSTHGIWTTQPNGDRVWKLGMSSRNALSLNFVMDQFTIPEGGQVFVYAPNKKQLLGSFTSENASPEGSLGVGLISGDQVIIEYIEPANVLGEGYIHINQLTYGYRDILNRIESLEKAGPFGSSGACNINVNCPEGLPFDIQKRSVALIVSNGNSVCTGALINTTAQDERPYFLTANHCLSSNTGNWVFYFNHETPDCAGDEDAPIDQSVSGSTILASNGESDFALLELGSDVPESYNVCYSGWDATDLESSVISAYGIHHPSGDVKKICFEDDAPYHSEIGAFVNQVWYIDQWELGVTEGGSSGSPLFNQSGNIIGQLAGGLAACNGDVNNGLQDYYGRLGVSWDFGSLETNSLQSWLDPNDTGLMVVQNSCGGSAAENDILISEFTDLEDVYCDLDPIYPSVTIVNMGTENVTSFSFSHTLNGGTPQTFEISGQNMEQFSSVSVPLGSITLIDGSNELKAEVIDVNNGPDENETGNIKIANPTAFGYSEEVTVSILLDDYPGETTWEIQNNDGDVLAGGGPYSDTQFTVEETICLGDGCYSFIIYDSFGDGICCGNGQGNYEVIAENGTIYGEGGNFTYEDQVDFCIEVNSVSDNPALKEINLYPNPAIEQVSISLGALTGQVEEVRMMDTAGRIVKTLSGNAISQNEVIQINTNALPIGLYFVSIHTSTNGVLTKRLVVSK